MEKLTREEVLHVARLAGIRVSEEEIEKYSIELKELIDEIDKIKDVESITDNILVTPVFHNSSLRSDSDTRSVDFSEVKKNLPKTVGKFVEVEVGVNE